MTSDFDAFNFDFGEGPDYFGEDEQPPQNNPEPSGVDNDEAVLAALEEVIEAEAAAIEVEQEYETLNSEAGGIQAQINELKNQLHRLEKHKNAVDNKLFTIRNRKRRHEQAIEAAKAKERVARENYERRIRAKQRISEFDEKAKQFAWYNGVPNESGGIDKILPHQWDGAVYLSTYRRAILADTMGTGKTLTSIATMDLSEAKRVLIVTPADVTSNFLREMNRWAPHRPSINLKGKDKKSRHMLMDMIQSMDTFTIVINYEIWRRDKNFLDKLVDLQFDTVIMDEAHIMKGVRTDAYEGMKMLVHAKNQCPQCGGLLNWRMHNKSCPDCGWDPYENDIPRDENDIDGRCSAVNVIPMTGSPILNSPEDLYTLLNLVDPVNFYNKNTFLNNYAMTDYNGKWTFRPGGQESLLKSLSGKFLARTMEDAGVILPEQKPIRHEIDLDKEQYPLQARTIEQLAKHAAIMLSDGRTMPVMATIAMITRQRQANVWPGGIRLTDPETGEIVFDVSEEVRESAKLDKAFDMIAELVEEGNRVAVFSQFKTGLAQLENMLEGSTIKAVRYDGDTPNSIREQVKTNFDVSRGEPKKWDVVLANYKTGGVGLNFTACTHMIIIDQEWNPGKIEQAYRRIHRIGQTKQTFVHILHLNKTIDTWHQALIDAKQDMVSGFNDKQQDLQAEYLKAIKSGEITG